MTLQRGIEKIGPVLELKIDLVGVVGERRGAVAPGECEEVARVIHSVGAEVLVNIGHFGVVGDLRRIDVGKQAFVVEPLGVVVGENDRVDRLVAAGHEGGHQLVVGVEVDVLDLRARHVLKGLLAVIFVGVVALPVGNVQRVSRPGELALGRGFRLRRRLRSCRSLGCGTAGAQSKHHDQRKDECQCFFHVLSSYYWLFTQQGRSLVNIPFSPLLTVS